MSGRVKLRRLPGRPLRRIRGLLAVAGRSPWCLRLASAETPAVRLGIVRLGLPGRPRRVRLAVALRWVLGLSPILAVAHFAFSPQALREMRNLPSCHKDVLPYGVVYG
jgi:hypothetical protein